jgi:hypothetical protein
MNDAHVKSGSARQLWRRFLCKFQDITATHTETGTFFLEIVHMPCKEDWGYKIVSNKLSQNSVTETT